MNEKMMPISLFQARKIADQQARSDLEGYTGSFSEVLENEYLEAEHCWMFFRSREIDVPLDATLGIKWAHVVSKYGTYSMVQDFSEDPQRLQAYLQGMSDHFKTRGE